MGISTKRAYTLRNRAIERYRDLDSQSRIFGLSHDMILAKVSEIHASIAKAPAYTKAYVQGYAACLRDAQYRNDLIWCHVAPDGTRYTAHNADTRPAWARDVRPVYDAGHGSEIATVWRHAHFWRNGKPLVTPMTFAESDAAYKARNAQTKES